jgi:hypothetical protein
MEKLDERDYELLFIALTNVKELSNSDRAALDLVKMKLFYLTHKNQLNYEKRTA